MKRLVPVVALVAAAGSGCGRREAPDPARPVVGVTLLTQTHEFFKELEGGLRDEAARRGLELVGTACEMDPARQAAQIEDFVAQRVAAILAAPCDSSAIVANLAGPERAGIPASWCSPSTFCVITRTGTPDRSSSTTARCAAFGSAFSVRFLRRICQERRRISGSPM